MNEVTLEKSTQKKQILILIFVALITGIIGLIVGIAISNATTQTSETPTNTSSTTSSTTSSNPCLETYSKADHAQFSFEFDNCKWTLTETVVGTDATDITLKNDSASLVISLTQAVSGMVNGNPSNTCNTDNLVLKKGTGTPPNYQDGLARVYSTEKEVYVYGQNYSEQSESLCVLDFPGIYVVQDIEGQGGNGSTPDTNNIYFIARPKLTTSTQQGKIDADEIVKAITMIKPN